MLNRYSLLGFDVFNADDKDVYFILNSVKDDGSCTCLIPIVLRVGSYAHWGAGFGPLSEFQLFKGSDCEFRVCPPFAKVKVVATFRDYDDGQIIHTMEIDMSEGRLERTRKSNPELVNKNRDIAAPPTPETSLTQNQVAKIMDLIWGAIEQHEDDFHEPE